MQFSDRQLEISDSGDMGAQNFNFAPKFPQNASNFVFLEDNFPTSKTIF